MKKIIVVIVLLYATFPVHAQDVVDSQTRAMIDRMDRLERDLTLVQRKIYKSDSKSDLQTTLSSQFSEGSVEHFYIKIGELEKVVAGLTSQVEENETALILTNEKLQKLTDDVNFRFQEMLTSMATTDSSAPVPIMNTKNIQKETPQELYDSAYTLLKKGDYDSAEVMLKSFIKKYPGDTLAGNAQYWLGETYYVRGSYDLAAVAFAEGVKKYKQSTKGADSLLKLGMSMARLGKKEEACTAFKSLKDEFPQSSAVLKERVQNEMGKSECLKN